MQNNYIDICSDKDLHDLEHAGNAASLSEDPWRVQVFLDKVGSFGMSFAALKWDCVSGLDSSKPEPYSYLGGIEWVGYIPLAVRILNQLSSQKQKDRLAFATLMHQWRQCHIRHTEKQWGRHYSRVPKYGRWAQKISEKFPCLNIVDCVAFAEYSSRILWVT